MIPVGNVKYRKFMGVKSKSLKSNPPIAWFLAKSKIDVIPIIPNFSYEKYRLITVGIEPSNIPIIKMYL